MSGLMGGKAAKEAMWQSNIDAVNAANARMAADQAQQEREAQLQKNLEAMTQKMEEEQPKPKPVATMPDEESPEALEAGRRRAAGLLQRGGRRNTILSLNGQSPNSAYARTLGGA